MPFPASPTVGQTYTSANGVQYEYTAAGTWRLKTTPIGLPSIPVPASQVEVDAGLDATKYVTPATLKDKIAPVAKSSAAAANQAFLQSTYTTITLGSGAIDAGLGNWAGNQFTVSEAGLYVINLQAMIIQFGNGVSNPLVASYINAGGTRYPADVRLGGVILPTSTGILANGGSVIVNLSPGDVVFAEAYASGGGGVFPAEVNNVASGGVDGTIAQLSITRLGA